MATNWKDVRDRAGLNEDRIADARARQLAEVRAHRLAEARVRRELTQAQVAALMDCNQTRVSAIERGDLEATELRTIARYVAALGGKLQVIADFGDEKLVLG